MFEVKDDLTIYCTRGDVVMLSVTADENGVNYIFQPGDVVRMKVFEKKDCQCVVMQKDVIIEETTDKVDILLTGQETRICEVISKPKDFWYEVELNPETNPQTIIGYDEDGAKVFRMFPEGKELEDIEERDLPFVEELRAEMEGIKSDAEKSADIADKRAVDAANSVTAASDMAEISRQNAVAAANSSSQASLFEQAAADDAANASAAADDANTAAQRSQTAANDAFEAKNSTLEAAARSAESEKNALEAADRTQSYSINPPYPDNEVWYIWDGEKYVATNEPSRGEKGEKGDRGIQGVKGDKGDQGVKGDTGATGADGKDGIVDYSLVANALKGNASGKVISLDDVSSLEHTLEVKASAEDGIDLSQSKVIVKGKNLFNVNSGNYVKAYAAQGVETAEGFLKITAGEDSSSTWGRATFHVGSLNGLVGKKLTFKAKYKHSSGAFNPIIAFMCTDFLIEGVITKGSSLPGKSIDGQDMKITAENGELTVVANIKPATAGTYKYFVISLYIQNGGASATGDWAEWSDIQLEIGDSATAYEPYTGQEYPVNADGTVEGVQSIAPNMTLMSDTTNVILSAQYNKDTNKVIEKLINRIAALESAVI